MTAKLQPDIEAVSGDFHDIEELVTERLHEIHKIYGLNTLRDIADRLKHSIDIDVEIATLLGTIFSISFPHCNNWGAVFLRPASQLAINQLELRTEYLVSTERGPT
jgi:hypothetical protein